MKRLDPALVFLLRQWTDKADADLEAAEQLASKITESPRLREIIAFHCQQTVEKYLKRY